MFRLIESFSRFPLSHHPPPLTPPPTPPPPEFPVQFINLKNKINDYGGKFKIYITKHKKSFKRSLRSNKKKKDEERKWKENEKRGRGLGGRGGGIEMKNFNNNNNFFYFFVFSLFIFWIRNVFFVYFFFNGGMVEE